MPPGFDTAVTRMENRPKTPYLERNGKELTDLWEKGRAHEKQSKQAKSKRKKQISSDDGDERPLKKRDDDDDGDDDNGDYDKDEPYGFLKNLTPFEVGVVMSKFGDAQRRTAERIHEENRKRALAAKQALQRSMRQGAESAPVAYARKVGTGRDVRADDSDSLTKAVSKLSIGGYHTPTGNPPSDLHSISSSTPYKYNPSAVQAGQETRLSPSSVGDGRLHEADAGKGAGKSLEGQFQMINLVPAGAEYLKPSSKQILVWACPSNKSDTFLYREGEKAPAYAVDNIPFLLHFRTLMSRHSPCNWTYHPNEEGEHPMVLRPVGMQLFLKNDETIPFVGRRVHGATKPIPWSGPASGDIVDFLTTWVGWMDRSGHSLENWMLEFISNLVGPAHQSRLKAVFDNPKFKAYCALAGDDHLCRLVSCIRWLECVAYTFIDKDQRGTVVQTKLDALRVPIDTGRYDMVGLFAEIDRTLPQHVAYHERGPAYEDKFITVFDSCTYKTSPPLLIEWNGNIQQRESMQSILNKGEPRNLYKTYESQIRYMQETGTYMLTPVKSSKAQAAPAIVHQQFTDYSTSSDHYDQRDGDDEEVIQHQGYQGRGGGRSGGGRGYGRGGGRVDAQPYPDTERKTLPDGKTVCACCGEDMGNRDNEDWHAYTTSYSKRQIKGRCRFDYNTERGHQIWIYALAAATKEDRERFYTSSRRNGWLKNFVDDAAVQSLKDKVEAKRASLVARP